MIVGMMINDLIKSVDDKISYLENYDFYLEMSKISDIYKFTEIMTKKGIEEKRKIELGIIAMSRQKDLSGVDLTFLAMYHKYLTNILENNPLEYYNNLYCSYMYSSSWRNVKTDNDMKEKKFINGKLLTEIEDILTDKFNSLMNKLRNGKELNEKERNFIEELILDLVMNSGIFKQSIDGEEDLMYDVDFYFKKYPINDISNPRNRFLELIRLLSVKMLEFEGNCAIMFSSDYSKGKNGVVLGSYFKDTNGISCIKINGVDILNLNNNQDFFEKIFTVFHELGHMHQHDFPELYGDNFKEIMEIEKYIIKHNKDFYDNNHDSFYIERDADFYACSVLLDEYCNKDNCHEKYTPIILNITNRELNRKRIDMALFDKMLLDEYNKLLELNNSKGKGR